MRTGIETTNITIVTEIETTEIVVKMSVKEAERLGRALAKAVENDFRCEDNTMSRNEFEAVVKLLGQLTRAL